MLDSILACNRGKEFSVSRTPTHAIRGKRAFGKNPIPSARNRISLKGRHAACNTSTNSGTRDPATFPRNFSVK
jgi:hypothetical protein